MRRFTDVVPILRIPISLLFLLCACGGEIDQEDELGEEGSEEEGRYELVIVEASQEDEPDSVQVSSTTREEAAVEGGAGGAEEPVDPGQQPVRFDPGGEFTVQVGAYKNSRIAGEIVRDLSGEGYPAYAIASPDGKEVRVRIGYFKTRKDAERFGRIFKEDRDKEYWVDRRSNEK